MLMCKLMNGRFENKCALQVLEKTAKFVGLGNGFRAR